MQPLIFPNAVKHARIKLVAEYALQREEVYKTMQMYEVTVMSEDMNTEITKEILFADDEDDAIDKVQESLQERGVQYGFCMASEI